MNDVIKVFSSPMDAPEHPCIGDLWFSADEDKFMVFDGIVWIPYTVEIMEQESKQVTIEETDSAEKAYDRAMGVLR